MALSLAASNVGGVALWGSPQLAQAVLAGVGTQIEVGVGWQKLMSMVHGAWFVVGLLLCGPSRWRFGATKQSATAA